MSSFVKGTWLHLTRAKDYQLAPIYVCHTTEDCQLTDPHKNAADFRKGVISNCFNYCPGSNAHFSEQFSKIRWQFGSGIWPGQNNLIFLKQQCIKPMHLVIFERPAGHDLSRVGLVFNRHDVLKYPVHGSLTSSQTPSKNAKNKLKMYLSHL